MPEQQKFEFVLRTERSAAYGHVADAYRADRDLYAEEAAFPTFCAKCHSVTLHTITLVCERCGSHGA